MATTSEQRLAAPKTDGALARLIVDHVRDLAIEYEDLVKVLVANLSREQLLALSEDCVALGLAADHVAVLVENCRRALEIAHEARRDEAGDFAYRRSVERELEHR